MTKRGFGVLVIFALLLLFALATGYSEIFFAVFVFGFIITFALATALAGVFVLRADNSLTKNVIIRRDVAPIKIFWYGFLPMPVIVKIILVFPGNNKHKYAALLWGNRHKAIKYQPICRHRGIWHIGIDTAYSCDVMGLFCFKILKSNLSNGLTSLTVYPHVYEIPGLPPPPVPTLDHNENNPIISDSGDSFADTRLYRDGDPLKRIHWKLSLRTRELHTRRYETSVDRMVVIVIDASINFEKSTDFALDYADMASECAASLSLYLLNGGHKVMICPTSDSDGVVLSTNGEFDIAHNYLATIKFNSDNTICETIQQLIDDFYCFSSFYIITHQPSDHLISLLSSVTSTSSAYLIYYDATGKAKPTDKTINGINLISISTPNDIPERLGCMYD
jgi:uncharacterized protein (DUF58 family)